MADLSFSITALDRASRTLAEVGDNLARLSRRLDEVDRREVNVKVKVDEPTLARAINGLAQLGRNLATLAKPVVIVGGLTAALPGLASLGGAVVATTGALWLLPAAGAAAGVAVGTLAVGVAGFGDAMKERADPAKFAEAIGKLSPAARDAAVTIRDLGPAWTGLRLDVQERLFAGVSTQVQALSSAYLPVLRSTLGGVATGFNQAAAGVAGFLASRTGVADISVGMDNVRAAVSTAAQAAVPLVRAFTDIFVVGAGFLPGFATSISNIATRFAEFISNARATGELAGWIRDGISTLGQLGSVAGSVGGILKGVFSAAAASGADTLGTVQRLTGELDTFLSTGVGNTALVTLFTTINRVVAALLPGLLAVAGAIAAGIVALGPSLPPLAEAFSDIAISLAPLITDLALLASVIIPPLAAGLSIVSPLLGPIAAGLIGMLVVTKVTAAIAGLTAMTMGYIAAQYGLIGVTAVGTGVLAPFRAAILALNAAFLANPIGIVVVALVGLAAALVFAYNHSETFRNIVDTAFRAVAAVGIWLWENALKPAFDGIMTGLRFVGDTASWLWTNVIMPVFGFIGTAAKVLFAVVATVLITPLIAAFKAIEFAVIFLWENVWRPIFTAIGEFAMAVWNNVLLPTWNALVGFVRDVIGPIVMWLWNNVVAPAWAAIGQIISFAWNNVILPVFNFFRAGIDAVGQANTILWTNVIKPVWDGLGAAIRFVWERVITPVFDGIKTGVDLVGRAFEAAVGFIGRVWQGVKAAVRTPIQAVIDVVYNNGVVKVWNFVASRVGLKGLDTYTLPGFATGGPIPGLAGRGVPILAHGNEHVVTDEEVRGAGGHAAVERQRAMWRGRGRAGVFADLQAGRIVEGADHEGPGISSVGFGGVKPHVARAGHYLRQRFGIASVGGVGARANASDHPRGLALDFMTYRDTGKGDRLVNYLLPQAGHYAVKYVIWKQRINSGGGWRGMADRGSITANHFDHPHVSFLDGPGGGPFAGGGDAAPAFDPVAWLIGAVGNVLGLADKLARGNPWADAMFGFGKKIIQLAWDKALSFVAPGLAAATTPHRFDPVAAGGLGLANGGIIRRPTFGLLGEAGPEAVVPLTRPRRAAEVLDQAGLGGGGSKVMERQLDELLQLLRDRPQVIVQNQGADPVEVAHRTVLRMRT